ncbi:ComF family protein [Pyrinomonas methylaliphatogenes]|uniref:Predicted amidophosphoribosyltransferase n=1 Tax=Pyrinomonas methylaliphatogenes TaxID=454194 RepID=A0A0B6WUZ2_9BACT|nr:phosphoribosyltransferase family protein [Pyrinomonas methylaliphatogenes]CDM64059.1 predicted amidophosphoribosyltransferase [Pyrinomonas methylaliphatogenes]
MAVAASSEFLGYDEFGHEQFNTKRTEVGELVYRVKYRRDPNALKELVDVVARFVKSKNIAADVIVPVPPTRARQIQPLFQIADALGDKLKLPVDKTAVKKSGTAELKDVWTLEERARILKNAISVDKGAVAGKRVLLIDDLVRSGATINEVAKQLKAAGVDKLYVVVLTETRRK